MVTARRARWRSPCAEHEVRPRGGLPEGPARRLLQSFAALDHAGVNDGAALARTQTVRLELDGADGVVPRNLELGPVAQAEGLPSEGARRHPQGPGGGRDVAAQDAMVPGKLSSVVPSPWPPAG